MNLSKMSVQGLEKLRDRVNAEITARLCEEVDFIQFEFTPCDDRTMGDLEFAAQTKHGIVSYKANLGSGYAEEEYCQLLAKAEDGEDWDSGKKLDDYVYLNLPGFHEDTDEGEAKRAVAKCLLAWEADYGQADRTSR